MESLQGRTVILLIPARTDTRWFHDNLFDVELRFIRGRLRFGGYVDEKTGKPKPALFPSLIAVLRPKEVPDV
jgi:site-specific DNA-methyltransferase (adenine-specific)